MRHFIIIGWVRDNRKNQVLYWAQFKCTMATMLFCNGYRSFRWTFYRDIVNHGEWESDVFPGFTSLPFGIKVVREKNAKNWRGQKKNPWKYRFHHNHSREFYGSRDVVMVHRRQFILMRLTGTPPRFSSKFSTGKLHAYTYRMFRFNWAIIIIFSRCSGKYSTETH